MYHRLISLLFLVLFGVGCVGLPQNEGLVFFKYSLWQDNGNLSDIGCVAAGIEKIRADLLFKGVNVGGAEAICSAFGNEDGLSVLDELGEFLSELNPTSFDELQITALRSDGSVVPFGLRLNDADRPIAEQQTINFASTVELSANQQLNISLPGEAGSQIDNELQMILP